MSTASIQPFEMQERVAPSRPSSLGTPRRRAPKGERVSERGASRSAGRRAPSLDTGKQVATSVANWLQDQETEWDRYNFRFRLWQQLLSTVHQLWQDAAKKPKDDSEQAWWNAYEHERDSLSTDENPAYDAWLEKYVAKHGLPTCSEAYLHCIYLTAWKRKNRPFGQCAEVLKWEKQYLQLFHCESMWIGKKAECCEDKTRPIAIPIGCNHRLCPMCNWRRSARAQLRTKKLFDRLIHPQFITLTVPNVKRISKRTFHLIRKRVRQFLAQHKEMFSGGVYAIETTYNRREKTWHVHAHVLVDATFSLPSSDWKFEFAGRNVRAFDYIKWSLEYDWSRLWCKELPKRPRKNASQRTFETERLNFEFWVGECWRHALREKRAGKSVPITGLSAAELARRTAWNKAHRRNLWIKPVDDRNRAAKEVLKYITKCVDFCDLPEAVSAFYDATKGARLIQTFGSWYGVDFEADFDTRHLDDCSAPQCTCGLNCWKPMGTFYRRDVEMDADGRWYLQRAFDHNSAGTVPRPTIRALEQPGRE